MYGYSQYDLTWENFFCVKGSIRKRRPLPPYDLGVSDVITLDEKKIARKTKKDKKIENTGKENHKKNQRGQKKCRKDCWYNIPCKPHTKAQSGGYSNSDAATAIEGKTSINRSRNHNNGSKRKNQPVNRTLANFMGGMPSVGDVILTVAEHHSTKNQFKTFQDKLKQYEPYGFDNLR